MLLRSPADRSCQIQWYCCVSFRHCRTINNVRCFLGSLTMQYKWNTFFTGKRALLPCKNACSCKGFAWIPSKPEEVGEFWFQRRRDFDPNTWRAKCRCKHSHEEHDPGGMHRCKAKGKGHHHEYSNVVPCSLAQRKRRQANLFPGCGCGTFDSNFLCAACDRHWEEHETIFETTAERIANRLPTGKNQFFVSYCFQCPFLF